MIVTVDTGSTSVAEVDAADGRGIDVLITDHHRVPGRSCRRRSRSSTRTGPTRPTPIARLSGSGVAFKVAQLLLADAAGRPGRRARPRRPGRDRDGRRRRPDPRREPGDRPARAGADADRAAARARRAARARPARRRRAVDLETVGVRARARGSTPPAGWGRRSTRRALLLADDPAEAAAPGRGCSRRPTSTRRDHDAARPSPRPRARSRRDAGRRRGDRRHGPWPVGIDRPRRRPPRRGARPAGDRRRGARRRRSGPPAGAPAARPGRRPGACDDLLHPPRRPRRRGRLRAPGRALGRRSGSGSWPSPARAWHREPARPEPERRSRPAGAATSTTPCIADLARLAPTGPGNPEPLSASLGLTVTRVRAANGRPHPARPSPRRLDVLDGIAFGWPDLADLRRRGRPDRRRRPARQPRVRRLRVAPARDPRRRAVRHRRRASATLLAGAPSRRPGCAGRRRADGRRRGARRDKPRRRARARARPPGDPYGLLPRTGLVAPAIAAIALVLIGSLTLPLVAGWHRGLDRRRRRPGQPATCADPTPAPSNVVVVPSRGRTSPARSSTPRPATSGSRRGGQADPADERRAATRCRRARPTASGSTSSARPPSAGYWPQRRARPGDYTLDVPDAHAGHARRAANRDAPERPYKRARFTWFYWLIGPAVVARTARPSPSSPTARPDEERRRPPALRPRDQQAHRAEARRRPRPSATRTPPGGPTAVLLYVRNGRDGPRGAPQI